MDSLQGHLLIASTDLHDPNFAQTVVLIAVHSEDGALGLILNREMNMSLSQVWGQVSQEPCLREENVRHGGPVGGTLMVLHDQRPFANLVVAEDLFVATELNAMEVAGRLRGRPSSFLRWPFRLGTRPARDRAGRGVMAGSAGHRPTRLRRPRHIRSLENNDDRSSAGDRSSP